MDTRPLSNNFLVKIVERNDGKVEFHLRKQYENIVFEGGGAKGLVYPTAVRILHDKNQLNHVRCYGGSSAGALTAAICSLGYKGEALEKVTQAIDTNTLLDRQSLSFSGGVTTLFSIVMGATSKRTSMEGESYLNSGNNLLMKSREIIRTRFLECFSAASEDLKKKMIACGIKHHIDINRITFLDLKYMSIFFPDEGFKDLVVTGTQLHGYTGFIAGQAFFNVIDTPNAEIALAALISSSIPFIFKRQRYLGKYYVDGGVIKNFPLDFFINREEFRGETLGIGFDRPPKHEQKAPELRSRDILLECLSGGNIDAGDWALYRYENRKMNKSINDYGVNIIHVDNGNLETLSFNASKEMIENAKLAIKKRLSEMLKNNSKYEQQEFIDEKEINKYKNILFNQPESNNNIIIYLDGELVKSKIHYDYLKNKIGKLLKEIDVDNTQNGISRKNVSNSLLDIEKIKARQVKLKKEMEEYEFLKQSYFCLSLDYFKFNSMENHPFKWLYAAISEMAKAEGDEQEIKEWLQEIILYYSPMDIVLNTGMAELDKAMLLSSIKKNIVEEEKILFLKKEKILNKILLVISEHYHFDSVSQLCDAMGEYYKGTCINSHIKYFSTEKPNNIKDILRSPNVINDILSMSRFDDLDLIKYDESIVRTSYRSGLVKQFEKEVEVGDARWIADLFVCRRLLQYFKENKEIRAHYKKLSEESKYNTKNLRPFALYLVDAYAAYFNVNLNDKNDWIKKCSSIVKIFTNSKLAKKDSSDVDDTGLIGIILHDLADEIYCYFKSLEYDISAMNEHSFNLASFSLPSFLIDEIGEDIQKWVLAIKPQYRQFISEPMDFKHPAELKSNMNANATINIENFDRSVTLFGTERLKKTMKLCEYINNHSGTWREDLSSMKNVFEFNENPLLKLLASSKLTRESSLAVLVALERYHYEQLRLLANPGINEILKPEIISELEPLREEQLSMETETGKKSYTI